MSLPASMAAIVGNNPAHPTIPVTTTCESVPAAVSIIPSGRDTQRIFLNCGIDSIFDFKSGNRVSS